MNVVRQSFAECSFIIKLSDCLHSCSAASDADEEEMVVKEVAD